MTEELMEGLNQYHVSQDNHLFTFTVFAVAYKDLNYVLVIFNSSLCHYFENHVNVVFWTRMVYLKYVI